MSKLDEWAKDYLAKVEAERKRLGTSGAGNEVPGYYRPVIIQMWLEDLAKAVIADATPPPDKQL